MFAAWEPRADYVAALAVHGARFGVTLAGDAPGLRCG
jgi:hypothetical protein